MVLWKCGSLRRSGRRRRRRRRRKTRGVGQSSETCSQWRQRPLSCLNGFSCSWGETKAGSRAESTVFNEARVAGGKVEVQYADGLQRPEGEKKQSVRLLLPHCLLPVVTCYQYLHLKSKSFLSWQTSKQFNNLLNMSPLI